MEHRPSLLTTLTPEEILLYWSLLSPTQQAAFIEEKLRAEAQLEGLAAGTGHRYDIKNTLFDRFAGLYHAFEMLSSHSEKAIQEERDKEAVSRLFGAKYDSLPVLLEKVRTRADGDPIMTYLTFLCAQQLYTRIRKGHPDFWRENRDHALRLKEHLKYIPVARSQLPLEEDEENEAFLEWYERMFLEETPQPEAV